MNVSRLSILFALAFATLATSGPTAPTGTRGANGLGEAPAPAHGYEPRRRGSKYRGPTEATRHLAKGRLGDALAATQDELLRSDIGPKRRRRYLRRVERLQRALGQVSA